MYPDSRNAELTPAYDLVSTLSYYPKGKERLALTLDGKKDFQSITDSSFGGLIKSLGIEHANGSQIVKGIIDASLGASNDKSVKDRYSDKQIDRISAHHAALSLLNP